MKLFLGRTRRTFLCVLLSSFEALGQSVQVRLDRDINIRSPEEGTLLSRVATLPKGSIVELSIDSFKTATSMRFTGSGASESSQEFVKGVRVISAPGVSETVVRNLNSRNSARGLYMAKQLLGEAEVVSVGEQTQAIVTNRPSDVFQDDDSVVPSQGEIMSRGSPNGVEGLHSVKRDQRASQGTCLAPVTSREEAREILTRNNVRVGPETNDRQLESLAMGIQQIELVAGTRSRYVSGSVFRFLKRRGYSEQTPQGIFMGANHTDGNVAHLIHELGHHAGNNGLYGPYKSSVGVCSLTNYSNTSYSRARYRNEEFSEVFSAFFTHPELLKNSRKKNCRDAYAFFARRFPNSRNAVCNREYLSAVVRNSGLGDIAMAGTRSFRRNELSSNGLPVR